MAAVHLERWTTCYTARRYMPDAPACYLGASFARTPAVRPLLTVPTFVDRSELHVPSTGDVPSLAAAHSPWLLVRALLAERSWIDALGCGMWRLQSFKDPQQKI